MGNLQDILNQFSKSEIAIAKEDILATIRNRRIVYEYNSKGEIINTFKSALSLREQGISIDNGRDGVMTRDGRVFSFNKDFPNFDSWYKKRKKQNSRSFIQLTPDGQFVKEWACMNDVERELGISRSNIRRYVRQGGYNKFGKIRTVGGFIWKDKF